MPPIKCQLSEIPQPQEPKQKWFWNVEADKANRAEQAALRRQQKQKNKKPTFVATLDLFN